MTIFLIVNVELIAASVLIYLFAAGKCSLADDLLNIFTVYFGLIVFMVMGLGLSGRLDSARIIYCTTAILVCACLLQCLCPRNHDWLRQSIRFCGKPPAWQLTRHLHSS